MRKSSAPLILGFVLPLIVLLPLHAQTMATAPTATKAQAASPSSSGQAPDDMTRKITELVHAGKYAEAQQLTAGLLVAYPNDQRLIKAKALIEKLLSSAGSANATPDNSQPATGATAGRFRGMDKVDYNSLIRLARQAQQTTDLAQQNTLLKQFMDESRAFLQKHPNEMLLWQLRAASALSTYDSDAGYEAGQRLLAAGAADSGNSNLQELLSKLKVEGWLDKQKVEEYKKNGTLGTWRLSWDFEGGQHGDSGNVVFSKSDIGTIDGYSLNDKSELFGKPFLRGDKS